MAAECLHCSHCLPLSLVGIAGGEQRSMTLCNGRGLAAGVAEGALQRLAELSASCGPLSGVVCWFALKVPKQSERLYRQYTWCWVLWEIVSKDNNYHLIYTHRPITKHLKVPIGK